MKRLDYRAAVGQKALILGKPFALIAVYAIAATLGSWWWLVAMIVIPFLASTMSVAMHDAGHGLVRGRARHAWLFVLGAGQMLSGHAFWATHSQHHKRYPADQLEDPEGAPTIRSFSGMMRMIPGFAPRLWLWAWRHKPGIRCWLFAEVCAAAGLLLLGTILYITHASPLLLVYCLSTLGTSWAGYALVSWLSHQSAILKEPRKQALAGTLLGSVLVFFFGVIIFHDEHHAEEAVPSCNLARFAQDVAQKSQGHHTSNPLSA